MHKPNHEIAPKSIKNYCQPLESFLNKTDFKPINLFSFGKTESIKSLVSSGLVHKIKVLRLINQPHIVESCFYIHRLHETINGIKTNFTSIFIHHNNKTEIHGLIHQQVNDDSVKFYDEITKDTYLKLFELAFTKNITKTVFFFNNNFFYLNTKHLSDDFFSDLSEKYKLDAWFALTDYDSRISNIGHLTAYNTIAKLKGIFVEKNLKQIQLEVTPSVKRDFTLSSEAFNKFIDIKNCLSLAKYDILCADQRENAFIITRDKCIRSNAKAQRTASELSCYLDEYYIEADQVIHLPIAKRKQLLTAYLVHYRTDLSTLDLNSLNRFIQRKNSENILSKQLAH